jgi:hypothetical protein
MATKQPSVPAPLPTNSAFSGKTVTVEFLKTQGNEPRDIFVGVNEYQAVIKRGHPVTIPVEVFDVLKNATYTDREFEDDDNPEKFVWVEKQRYPYNVLSRSDADA